MRNEWREDHNRKQFLHGLLAEEGFHFEETGGGCTGWVKDLPDGGHLLIATEEASAYGPPGAQVWTIGRYGPDDLEGDDPFGERGTMTLYGALDNYPSIV